ncbi:MAG: DUF3194 domain-containing protein [Methanosphaera sp.]|nr:DUF3194 domain-containing protein [Methanosphaera sp.]
MIKLTDEEVEQVIDIAYTTCEKYILGKVSKKTFEDITITIDLESLDEGFDLDISIDLDSDIQLPEDLSQTAVDKSLEAVDEYIDNRNKSLR